MSIQWSCVVGSLVKIPAMLELENICATRLIPESLLVAGVNALKMWARDQQGTTEMTRDRQRHMKSWLVPIPDSKEVC